MSLMLTHRELEKLYVYVLADVARRRGERGRKLNASEATALICEMILEGARDGRRVADLASEAREVVRREEVMEGVPETLSMVQIEATFPDGTKLVSVHDPIP